MEFSNLLQTIVEKGIQVIIALIILIVAFKIIGNLAKKVDKKLEAKLDPTLVRTIVNAGKILLDVLVVMALVGYLGIDTSGIAAVFASIGVCVGLAVNGALSNFAGGVLILITRPFKIGDYISAQGYEGTVEEIKVISTKIITLDNKAIYIPNGALSSGSIVNYTEKDIRRVDLNFTVGGNDPEKVRSLILSVCDANELVLKDPAPFAMITDYGAGNGVIVTMRAWTKASTYWDVYLKSLDDIRKAFDENGIVVPFNQLDVHIKQ